MSRAVCDKEGREAFLNLVYGELKSLDELSSVEQFMRAYVLHDEMVVEFASDIASNPGDDDWSGLEQVYGSVDELSPSTLTAGRGFNPDIELSPRLLECASQYAKGRSDIYRCLVASLKRMVAIVRDGGSAVLLGEFGQSVAATAEEYPAGLFQNLDEAWKRYVAEIHEDGLGLLVPPVVGIILTRSARRNAIPHVLLDLRREWADARGKVWSLLHTLRTAPTLGEALQIRRDLAAASGLFTPEPSEHDTRPVRVLWEIVAAASVGLGIAALSAGKPVVGAVTGAMAQASRTVPGLLHEFGPAVFGRGAFDLARRVSREVSKIELGALPRLLTEAEKRKLGFG